MVLFNKHVTIRKLPFENGHCLSTLYGVLWTDASTLFRKCLTTGLHYLTLSICHAGDPRGAYLSVELCLRICARYQFSNSPLWYHTHNHGRPTKTCSTVMYLVSSPRDLAAHRGSRNYRATGWELPRTILKLSIFMKPLVLNQPQL